MIRSLGKQYRCGILMNATPILDLVAWQVTILSGTYGCRGKIQGLLVCDSEGSPACLRPVSVLDSLAVHEDAQTLAGGWEDRQVS